MEEFLDQEFINTLAIVNDQRCDIQYRLRKYEGSRIYSTFALTISSRDTSKGLSV